MRLNLPVLSARKTIQEIDADDDFQFLKLGNTKLGPTTKTKKNQKRLVWHFDLPAVFTCMFSAACIKDCYACKGSFYYHMSRYIKNLLYATFGSFIERIVNEIRLNAVVTLRLHVSGDFFSKAYCYAWLAIFRALPNVKFYFYTRSWQDADMLEAFKLMAALPNVFVWFSTDATMPFPPKAHKRIRVAYMLQKHENKPKHWSDLVFRVSRNNSIKRINNVLVCPVEQGVARKVEITCSKCQICFQDKKYA